MNTTIQNTLLDLCQQVIADPDHIPTIALNTWPEGTEQQQLLTCFRDMLGRLQQHYRDKLEAQERFSLAVQGVNDGLWVQHLQTNEAYFSPRWKSMLGYEEDEISNSVDEWRLRLHPDDVDQVLECGRANIAGEIDTYEIEYRLRHKDGSYRWVLSRATTLRDASGKAYRLAGSNTDITLRKLAEEQLREREEQYRSIFEASSDGLYIIDLDGFVVEANPAAHRQLGYTYEELIGMHRNAFLHPDYRSLVPEYLQVIQAGDQFQGRAVDVRKDGTIFPVEVRGKAFTYKGQPHTLSVVRDITRQVEAEQQLREREEQYRSIFEATTDGLAIVDLEDGCMVEVNPAECQMHGYFYEEMIGNPPTFTVHPDSLYLVTEALQTIRSGGQFHAQGVALRKDGIPFPFEVHLTPFLYKSKPHILSVTRDITERVQAEQQLREKEEQYHSIFEATYDGLVINDLDGFCVEANPTYCRMLGYTYEEIIGLHYSKTTFPEYYPILDENSRTIRAGAQFQTQGLARRKDGSSLPVEALSTPFTYKGKPHMLGVMRDITERVQAEQQLREKEEQYRSIFEATSDGLIIRDMDGFVVEANPAAYAMHGYTYQEFLGLHRTDIIAPEDHSMVTEYMKAIQAGRTFRGQAVDLRKDGTAFPVEVRGSLFTFLGKPHTLSVLRDITERVQAEQQLLEKEEQYRSVFEATTDGLIIIDLEDSRAVEVNPRACQMFGYTYEEMLGRHVGLNDTTQEPPVYALDVIRAGGFFQMRETATGKDGIWFNAEVHATPFTYKGKPHTLAIVRDITEQVQAEKQLREKEEQYRSIFEATNDGLDIIDSDGFIFEANPAFCSIFGYTREELIGIPAGTLTAPQSRHLVEESRESIKEGRDIQVEGLAMRKDGSIFHAEAHLTSLIYQGKPHMLGVTRDITERVEAERQLREKEEQYRTVFETTTDGLVILDPDGFYVEANPAMCSMYGYTNEELIGLHTSVLTAPASHLVLTTSMEKIKVGKGFQAEGQGLRKDGSVFYAEAHLTPITYQGKPHLLAATHDITERVQAQQLLEQRVEERTRELSALLEVSHNVASTIELKPLLDLILDQLKAVVNYTGSSLTIVEYEDLVLVGTRGPESEEHLIHRRFSLKHFGLIWEMICRREPVIIDDVRDDAPLAQAYREAVGELLQTTLQYIHSWIGVPLIVKERVIGLLAASHSESNYYKPHHATLALAIANQAAIAIENARLYEQAQELAAIEERQRLARELHDSVSQALYGISLGVHTARLQLDSDPAELAESLDYVLELAEAALTEMRALIFELRPESLEAEGLITALTKQAAAMQARHNIIVQLDLCDEPDVSLKVKRELYRVAQEALHNTVKHAEANKVDLHLHMADGVVILEVRDDGKGFEATGSFPGHLGLRSMRERIESLDGGLQIESVPSQGTSIRAHIPVRETTTLNGR